MRIAPVSNRPSTSFGTAYRVYFISKNDPTDSEGDPIDSEEYMKKCHRYMQNHLNHTKKAIKSGLNQELIDTFKKGDEDYRKLPMVRIVPNESHINREYLTIVTGKDAAHIDKEYGLKMGSERKKRIAARGINGRRSFEEKEAARKYRRKAADYAKNHEIRPAEDKRIVIEATFKPLRDKNGDLDKFEYQSLEFVERKIEDKK